ncbi:MAG: TetR/AcrR family transcriptional regulator [Chloroflexi bacterium]|nr:TetR/AcrR family transcriptional regulator [Chloroflexota bacterium]
MDTRQKLLQVALNLFSRYGYDAVGVQTIVEEAGVTKPTLYHYFGSKQGLFETLVKEKSQSLLEAIQLASAYHGDITKSIKDVVNEYFKYAQAQPTFYRMILSLWFAPPSSEYSGVVQELLLEQTRLLEAMFEAAVQNHGNMRGRHQQYAVSLKGMIDTYIGLSFQGHIQLNDNVLNHKIVHQFMHGIFS